MCAISISAVKDDGKYEAVLSGSLYTRDRSPTTIPAACQELKIDI